MSLALWIGLLLYAIVGSMLMTIGALFDNAPESEIRRASWIGVFVGIPWAVLVLLFLVAAMLYRPTERPRR
jgi:hypothetical protein